LQIYFQYDLNKSGTITKDEFRDILQMMIGANVSQEQVDSIAERYISIRFKTSLILIFTVR
jgi:Ca2+-binding EF-hand superfamily protein